MDFHADEHGYEEMLPPYMANRASITGTGQLPKFEEDAFCSESEDYFLIPTAEVPVTNFYRDEILDGAKLPQDLLRSVHVSVLKQVLLDVIHAV